MRGSFLLGLGLLAMAAAASPVSARWARTFGGPGMGEGVHAARELPSGELVVLASTDSFGTLTGDAWLIRMDADGNVTDRWLAGHALPGGVDGGVVLADGGAVFAHRNVRDIFTHHDASISLMAADGTIAWTTDVSADPGRFFVNDVIAVADGTFVGVGQAAMTDGGPHVGWAIALDASGNMLWQQYHGGVVGTAISLDSGTETSDGGFAVAGSMTSGIAGDDMFVAKLTPAGALSWTITLGGSSSDRGAAILELPGGDLVIAGSTDSFTASGHAGWIVRLSATGVLVWDVVLGEDEWSDLQAVALGADGRLVALGRIAEAGFPTNDLWALGLDASSGAIAWQRAYEGDSGDLANEIAALTNEDLLLAGVWGFGFPEEDLWLLRTDAEGRIDSCSLVRDTSVTGASSGARPSTQFLPPYPPFGSAAPGSVVTDSSGITVTTQCEASPCPPVTCGPVVAVPDPACEGELVTLSIEVTEGTPPYDVGWDLDGDGIPDISGNPVMTVLQSGTITALVSDACGQPWDCEVSQGVVILPATPPGEVSDVLSGALPLLVLDHGASIRFEERADAQAYNIHAGAIGAWGGAAAPVSTCFVTTSPGDPGRLETTPALAANTWLVVTASNECAEGSAGRDSFGDERMASGSWTPCGGAP